MTTAELQELYDKLGSQRSVAEYLHRSTSTIGPWLRAQGVDTKPHGGQKPTPGCRKIPLRESKFRENQEDGDGAIFARPVKAATCDKGLLVDGKPKRCVMDKSECPACLRGYDLAVITGGGAASGWTREMVEAHRWW